MNSLSIVVNPLEVSVKYLAKELLLDLDVERFFFFQQNSKKVRPFSKGKTLVSGFWKGAKCLRSTVNQMWTLWFGGKHLSDE